MKALLYWASWVACLPLTLLGAALYLFGLAIPFRVDADGVIHWRALPYSIHALLFRYAGAYTMGACICWPPWTLGALPPATLKHEKRHVRQMRLWMSAAVALFFLTYLAMAGWSLVRTGNIWEANPIEIDADRP